jgi:hypothetical protein
LLTEGLISTLKGLQHWNLDAQREPVGAAALRSGVRDGWGAAGRLDLDAQKRFWAMGAVPRAYVCHSDLMGSIEFVSAGAAVSVRQRGAGPVREIVRLVRPDYQVFADQLMVVHQWSVARPERAAEILPQVYPADAWWSSIVGLRGDRHRKTLEFLDAALNVAVPVIFRIKQMMRCPRPFEYSAAIAPLIQTPGHDTWPSGHSTESFLVARILASLTEGTWGGPGVVPSRSPEGLLMQTAARIAENREVAGVHFPVDSVAGCVLGDSLARYILSYSGAPVLAETRDFDPVTFYAGNHVAAHPLLGVLASLAPPSGGACTWSAAPAPAAAEPYMTWLWEQARAEWV